MEISPYLDFLITCETKRGGGDLAVPKHQGNFLVTISPSPFHSRSTFLHLTFHHLVYPYIERNSAANVFFHPLIPPSQPFYLQIDTLRLSFRIMSYGGGYGRSRNGYGDSNGHTNGYAICDVYSTFKPLLMNAPWARDTSSYFQLCASLQRSDQFDQCDHLDHLES